MESSAIEQQQLQQQSASQKSLIPLRKQSPPTWSKLGTDILTAAGRNNVNVELGNTVATTAAAVVTEQSRSFLDAASKQFRDFSKQVFRQNLSFGNEAVTTASTTTITSSTVNNPHSGAGAEDVPGGVGPAEQIGVVCAHVGACGDDPSTCIVSSYATPSMECNVDSLPTDVKQEIKENISPEHTINEGTLHTMQKLGGTTAPATADDFRNDSEDLLTATSWDTQTRFESE